MATGGAKLGGWVLAVRMLCLRTMRAIPFGHGGHLGRFHCIFGLVAPQAVGIIGAKHPYRLYVGRPSANIAGFEGTLSLVKRLCRW